MREAGFDDVFFVRSAGGEGVGKGVREGGGRSLHLHRGVMVYGAVGTWVEQAMMGSRRIKRRAVSTG